ncbi:MAG: HD domain-containing protein [Bacteroidales bacterium]|nr:HD domain-containing protein [Bacteroidales bacterium]
MEIFLDNHKIKINFTLPEIVTNIIHKYYPVESVAYKFYFTHCLMVTDLAVKIFHHNPHLNLNLDYIIKGALLHDIGIIKTDSPQIGCYGTFPYIAHTYLGRQILEDEGLPEIAPVCERHVGTGLTKKDIIKAGFPLPHRDMMPISLEEKLICYADKFYSKSANHLLIPKTPEKIRKKVGKYGNDKLKRFEEFVEIFGIDYIYSPDY